VARHGSERFGAWRESEKNWVAGHDWCIGASCLCASWLLQDDRGRWWMDGWERERREEGLAFKVNEIEVQAAR
jgi:hypothetical protein